MLHDTAATPTARDFPKMSFTFATLCSGVDAPSCAFEPLGATPVFFSEIAPDPIKVLEHHWPDVPNLGDMLDIDGYAYRGLVDVLWASFPCQAWSEAGGRKGLKDDRGLLTLAGVRLVDEIAPPVFLFENVRGLLTDKENGFGYFLGSLAGEHGPLVPVGRGGELLPAGTRWSNAGYVRGPKRAIAWRLLDAQYFDIPQQRERVMLVACDRASGLDPRDVLFEKRPAADAARERDDRQARLDAADGGGPHTYGVAIRGRTHDGVERQQVEQGGVISHCLRAAQGGSDKEHLLTQDEKGDWRLRVMTALEAERCMGLPDNHTLVPVKGKRMMSESGRLKMIGNSVAVPVIRWLGERLIAAKRATRKPWRDL